MAGLTPAVGARARRRSARGVHLDDAEVPMDMVRAFLADDGGDTTTGVALGALLVLVVVLLIFVMGGFGQPQQDQPGIDINIRQRT